jgi:hypothetical protein
MKLECTYRGETYRIIEGYNELLLYRVSSDSIVGYMTNPLMDELVAAGLLSDVRRFYFENYGEAGYAPEIAVPSWNHIARALHDTFGPDDYAKVKPDVYKKMSVL